MQNRKVTFKLYPNVAQSERLDAWVRLHCELYNAALQERIEAYRKAGKSISYYDQQNVLPAIKSLRPEFAPLGSHALQQTLRRLDLAFAAFFRRVKAGQKPGFPRFKSQRRYPGFTYPDPAGWAVQTHSARGATLRVGSGKQAMSIRARGRHRFGDTAKPNDLTLIRKHGEWFASITLRVDDAEVARPRENDLRRGVDFGLSDWATFDDGSTIENPRWVREGLPHLRDLQRQLARKCKGSLRFYRLRRAVARHHDKIANQRKDFIHKETSRLVQTCTVLATEELRPSNMSRSAKGTTETPGRRVRQKAGLNREILSAGFGMAHNMLQYKAAEAGTRLHIANTRQLKPTQRCSGCGRVEKKSLAIREHHCPECGLKLPRDQNSALVVLLDAYMQDPSGTDGAERAKPQSRQRGRRQRSVIRETPATTPTGV